MEISEKPKVKLTGTNEEEWEEIQKEIKEIDKKANSIGVNIVSNIIYIKKEKMSDNSEIEKIPEWVKEELLEEIKVITEQLETIEEQLGTIGNN